MGKQIWRAAGEKFVMRCFTKPKDYPTYEKITAEVNRHREAYWQGKARPTTKQIKSKILLLLRKYELESGVKLENHLKHKDKHKDQISSDALSTILGKVAPKKKRKAK